MSGAATYLALADLLEREIVQLHPGERVPSEHALASTHEVNRLTARAALQELERRHLVRRVQGAGTFVARRIEHRIAAGSPPSLSATIAASGLEIEQRNVRARTVRPPAWVRDDLGLRAGERTVVIQRSTVFEGEVVACSTSWLVAALVPDLARSLPAVGSLFAALDALGLAPERSRSRAELEVVPADVARALGLAGRPLAWSLVSVNRSRTHERPLEVSSSWLRADLFRVVFELGGP